MRRPTSPKEWMHVATQSVRAARPRRLTPVGIVFIVAVLNGAAWSLLTPPFQVPDETAHFAYSQSLAEASSRPGVIGRPEFSSEQNQAMATMGTLGIIGRSSVHPPVDGRIVSNALEVSAKTSPRGDGGGPSSASSQPPLYYALASLPYRAFSSATLSTRLQAMRALSVVIFAFGAAFSALLAAEILRGRAWVPLVGGMAVALSPYTAFIASGVTPDTLLLTVSVATLLLIARGFRRGVTMRWAVTLGLVVGAGTLTKLTYLAFVPPTILVMFFLVIRDRRKLGEHLSRGVLVFGLAIVAAAALPSLNLLWTELSEQGEPSGTGAFAIATGSGTSTNIREIAVYGWQLFLPRLPFMSQQFAYSPLVSTWIDGFAGRYGWLDYSAPSWVVGWYRIFIVAIGVLAGSAFIAARQTAYAHRVEFVMYFTFFVAQAAVIAKTGYDYRRSTGYVFEQPRYLFGFAGFYSTLVAIACRGVGNRLAPRLAIMFVGLLCLHDVSGLAQTTVRYYG